uniref:Serpentine receptor class gamma n=1 Tax=Caenorhabditis tropicalis TaxID=1561998 RepID=A0A1I7URD8_9PELO
MTQFLAMLFQEMNLNEVRLVLHSKFPQYNLTGLTVTGAVDVITFAPLYTLIHMTIISIPLATLIQVLRRKIILLLIAKGIDLTTRSRNLHAQLLRTLTFQATVPLIYFLDVFFFFLTHIWSHPILEFLIIIPSLIVPILTPLSSLFYVTPYRKFVSNLFFMRPMMKTVSSQSIQIISLNDV